MKNYLITKEQYAELKKSFKAYRNPSSSSYLIYNLLRSYPANRGFTPITNSNKLANGLKADSGFENAKMYAELIITRAMKYEDDFKLFQTNFGKFIDKELLAKLLEQVK